MSFTKADAAKELDAILAHYGMLLGIADKDTVAVRLMIALKCWGEVSGTTVPDLYNRAAGILKVWEDEEFKRACTPRDPLRLNPCPVCENGTTYLVVGSHWQCMDCGYRWDVNSEISSSD